jgi:predicted nucleic acid-binding protein
MADLLLDTNIISFALKSDSRRALYDAHVAGRRTCVSFMTVAELYSWAVGRRWGQPRRNDLLIELDRHVALPYDDALAWAWARVRTIKGRPVDPSDAWIAATALRYGLTLVTHNRRHFEGIPGLQIISEAK